MRDIERYREKWREREKWRKREREKCKIIYNEKLMKIFSQERLFARKTSLYK